MSFTESDLTAINSAILAITAGNRKDSITIAGQRIDYAKVTLTELRAMRDEIKAELDEADSSTSAYCYISTSKGL